jgi:hypothetical protein
VVEVWSEPLRSSGSVGGVVSTFIMVQASAVVHTGTSSRTDESKTFSIATWNIKIFNIMVDAIVREWLLQSLGEAEPGMPEYEALSCIFLALFYADDRYIASTDDGNVVDCSALIGHSTLHTQHRNTVGRQRKGRCNNRLQ